MQDNFTFIDIHTHHFADDASTTVYRINNVAVDKDTLPDNPCSVGIHPWYLHEDGKFQLQILYDNLLTNPSILAVGECGLDKITDTPWETQKIVFSRQLQLSNEFSKPVIIHCVRAYQEIIRLVKDAKMIQSPIIHGFNKHPRLAEQLIKQGFYLSLGANILTGRQDELIRSIPLHRLFFETDDSTSPISEIYMYFCRVRKMSLSALKMQISANFDKVFNL